MKITFPLPQWAGLCFLLITSLNVHAQLDDPLSSWVYTYKNDQTYSVPVSLTILGDSLINGEVYQNISGYFLREENGRWYAPFEESEVLYFDENLEVGDTLFHVNPYLEGETPALFYIYELADTITLSNGDTTVAMLFTYDEDFFSSSNYWFRGVGPDELFNSFGGSVGFSPFTRPLVCYSNSTGLVHEIPLNSNENQPNLVYEACFWYLGLESTRMQNQIQVWPNPTPDKLNIELSDELLSSKLKLFFYDSSGKVRASFDTDQNSRKQTLSVAQFPKGIYYLVVSDGSQILKATTIMLE